MNAIEVTALFSDLTQVELVRWVEQGWVVPDAEDNAFVFREIDVARVRLIHDLRRSMEIGEETMPLVLSLLDQIYTLRGTMRDLVHALEAQPAEVRTSVLATLRRR